MSSEPEEERFARQDSRRYSGWSSALTLAVIVMRNVRFWHKADIGATSECALGTQSGHQAQLNIGLVRTTEIRARKEAGGSGQIHRRTRLASDSLT
jgi:hypothetical protein